jgi:mono/diheme cytochrome c family protein
MVIRFMRNVVMSCLLASTINLCEAQEKQAKKVPVTHSNPPSGAALYKQHCAVCHGNDLKGNGPSPYPFRGVPPDLTTLAQRHDGKFPEAYVSDVLRNGVKVTGHGPVEMPVWGPIFKMTNGSDEPQVTSRITNLSNYIRSLQAKIGQ